MAIAKGSRVEFMGPDRKMLYGLVFKVSGGMASIVSDTGATFRGDIRSVRESTQPIPRDHLSRRFAKGDRVEFESRHFSGRRAGVVAKIDQFGFLQIAADDGETWRDVSAAKAVASKAPLPEGLARIPSSYAKGDRVEFVMEGRTVYGVVSKGGSSRVQVTQDGGEIVHTGPVRAFLPSKQPVAAGGPDAMDRWSVASYKLHASLSEETPCFEAVIAHDGRKAVAASNRGTGGSDDFHPLAGSGRAAVDRLEADAKAWARRFDPKAGERSYSEDASSWLDWEVNKKPYGVTARAYFEDRNRLFDEMMSGKSFRP